MLCPTQHAALVKSQTMTLFSLLSRSIVREAIILRLKWIMTKCSPRVAPTKTTRPIELRGYSSTAANPFSTSSDLFACYSQQQLSFRYFVPFRTQTYDRKHYIIWAQLACGKQPNHANSSAVCASMFPRVFRLVAV